MAKQFRQGDVLIQQIAETELPKNASKIDSDAGRTILAYGEVTGHAHALQADLGAVLHTIQGQEDRILTLDRQQALRHEEHAPIQLPAGNFKITIQREYQYGRSRQVAD